jgi:hypothetical protein
MSANALEFSSGGRKFFEFPQFCVNPRTFSTVETPIWFRPERACSMPYTLLGFTLLLVLAVVIMPVPRVRQWLWTTAARMSQAMVLAFLGACGTFFVQPSAAPEWLVKAADPIINSTLGLPLDANSGLPWLVVAVLAVVVTLPVLMLVELGLNLSTQTVQVQSLRKELRQAATWVDSRLGAVGIVGPAYPPLTSEGAAAVAALRSVSQSGKEKSPATAPLVIDLLK